MKKKLYYYSLTGMLVLLIACLSVLNVEAQVYKKKIIISEEIKDGDTVRTYDTIVIHSTAEEMEGVWEDMDKDIEDAIRSLSEIHIPDYPWEGFESMMEGLDSMLSFDFDFDVMMDPPHYKMYYNDGRDSISSEWESGSWNDFERSIKESVMEIHDQVKQHMSSLSFKDAGGELSFDLIIREETKGIFTIHASEEIEIQKVKVIDDRGSTVFERGFEKVPDSIDIDLSDQNGYMFVEVGTNKGEYFKKLQIK